METTIKNLSIDHIILIRIDKIADNKIGDLKYKWVLTETHQSELYVYLNIMTLYNILTMF